MSEKVNKDGEPITRVCFVAEKSHYRQLKVAAAMAEVSVSEVLREASEQFIKKVKAKSSIR